MCPVQGLAPAGNGPIIVREHIPAGSARRYRIVRVRYRRRLLQKSFNRDEACRVYSSLCFGKISIKIEQTDSRCNDKYSHGEGANHVLQRVVDEKGDQGGQPVYREGQAQGGRLGPAWHQFSGQEVRDWTHACKWDKVEALRKEACLFDIFF